MSSYHRPDPHADAGTRAPRQRGTWISPGPTPSGGLGRCKAVGITRMYLRQNVTQGFLGDNQDVSQPTVSRYITALIPVVKAVLEELVPSAADATEMVKGRPEQLYKPTSRSPYRSARSLATADRRAPWHLTSPDCPAGRRSFGAVLDSPGRSVVYLWASFMRPKEGAPGWRSHRRGRRRSPARRRDRPRSPAGSSAALRPGGGPA